jgi:hypothetical protein
MIVPGPDRVAVIRAVLEERFNFRPGAYWHPLVPQDFEPKLVFGVHDFLGSALARSMVARLRHDWNELYDIWEYEWAGSQYWLITLDEFDFDWYSERAFLLPDYSGLIYFSHEETVCFAGGSLVGPLLGLGASPQGGNYADR